MSVKPNQKSVLLGLEECPLHRRTPFGIKNSSTTQFSIARFYGAIKYNGEWYTYAPNTDELIRDDVLKWKRKKEKANRQPQPPSNDPA